MSMADELDGPSVSPRPGTSKAPLSLLERAQQELNDRGNARRLAAALQGDVIWCPEWGWGVWCNTHYEFDAGEVRAFEACQRLPDFVMEEADAWAKAVVDQAAIEREIRNDQARPPRKKKGSVDPETAERVIRAARWGMLRDHAETCGNVTIIDRAMKALRPMMRVSLADFDSQPLTLNVLNGCVDLARAIEAAPEAEDDEERAERWAKFLRPTDRSMLPTRVAGCRFEPGAAAPAFQRFLDLIMPAVPMQAYLRRCAGQMLTGRNDLQIALLLAGDGANGKSTLMAILSGVLGSYVAGCNIDLFIETPAKSAGGATPDEAYLPGARVYVASEPRPDAALADDKLKSMTGSGDTRMSRRNYGEFFSWSPHGLPVLSFNRMPAIKGDSFGTRRRLAFIPFDRNLRELPEDQQRKQADVLAEMEAERPGILNWMIEGMIEAHALGGIRAPEAADIMKDALLAESDPVGEFIKACIAPREGARIRTSRFYDIYAAWADENGARVWKATTVKKTMVQKKYTEVTVKGYTHWDGLDWNTEEATLDLLARIGDRTAARG